MQLAWKSAFAAVAAVALGTSVSAQGLFPAAGDAEWVRECLDHQLHVIHSIRTLDALELRIGTTESAAASWDASTETVPLAVIAGPVRKLCEFAYSAIIDCFSGMSLSQKEAARNGALRCRSFAQRLAFGGWLREDSTGRGGVER